MLLFSIVLLVLGVEMSGAMLRCVAPDVTQLPSLSMLCSGEEKAQRGSREPQSSLSGDFISSVFISHQMFLFFFIIIWCMQAKFGFKLALSDKYCIAMSWIFSFSSSVGPLAHLIQSFPYKAHVPSSNTMPSLFFKLPARASLWPTASLVGGGGEGGGGYCTRESWDLSLRRANAA